MALTKGEVRGGEAVATRIHSECFTGDTLLSMRCDCGEQLQKFLRFGDTTEAVMLLYIRGHEGRGIGLANKIRAYKLQEEGLDTVDANLRLGFPADLRKYESAVEVLTKHLGVQSVTLYSNNPEKVEALRPIIAQVVRLPSQPLEQNRRYLECKAEKCGHRTILQTFQLPQICLPSTTSVGVVYTKWNDYYVQPLPDSCTRALEKVGVEISAMAVPGATEIVSGARSMLRKRRPDAVICIAVLIRGSTDQHEMVGNAVCQGITTLNAAQDVPIVQGVLMCRDEKQARERSISEGNHGAVWAKTALMMVSYNEDEEKRTP